MQCNLTFKCDIVHIWLMKKKNEYRRLLVNSVRNVDNMPIKIKTVFFNDEYANLIGCQHTHTENRHTSNQYGVLNA